MNRVGRRLGGLVAVVVVCALAQVSVGSTGATLGALFGEDWHARMVVLELRAPRVLVGLCAGACLGVAGTILQSAIRNQLASPEITGVGSGAVLGAVLATVAGASQPVPMAAAALVGGVLGGGVLWVVAGRSGDVAVRGVVVSAVLVGTTLVLLTARPQLAGAVSRWLLGSLVGRTWEHLAPLWPVLLVVLVAATLLGGVLDVLAVDDDHAHAVGLAVVPWRSGVLVLAALATSAAVAAMGATAFVGLLAPHLARRLVGAVHRDAVPAAALTGAASVAAADTVGQLAHVPAGAITALLGAGVLIVVARRTGGIG
ncbi:iron ABC transporter permease [Actinosynnema sp. NPDC047251]|uniref:Putative secreted protein n=1 Tax=Saccharothrix espanaensis (strain ATCC 51144 / DSM 44229 / JCM 9112 / NBRC 15066 / NRRL 15764) TaxID=1179773 RepID=K0JX49_SACES|nr:iron ABC transporter permease [Saccharothrix espanaensis]CCH30601.1 putative secreted protein [Saccharothrix espanaensis DSM 44229]